MVRYHVACHSIRAAWEPKKPYAATAKTAPAGPLRYERQFKRAHGKHAARGRATGRALRGERSGELQAREDELRMAARRHRADVQDGHPPRDRRGGRRAQAQTQVHFAPRRRRDVSDEAVEAETALAKAAHDRTTHGRHRAVLGLDRANRRVLGARTRLRKAKCAVKRARLAQVLRGDGALASGDTVVRAGRVPRFAKADRLDLDELKATRGIVLECYVRYRDAQTPPSPRARPFLRESPSARSS